MSLQCAYLCAAAGELGEDACIRRVKENNFSRQPAPREDALDYMMKARIFKSISLPAENDSLYTWR
jgi:hypothetical protein